MDNINNYKAEDILLEMSPNRTFYLYRLKYSSGVTLPNFVTKFGDDKIKENILDINISEEEND